MDTTAVDGPALVERREALDALWTAYAAAQAGDGRVVLVHGEAGVGKSSLARVFADAVATRSRVRWGACDPLSTPRAHGPLRDIAAAVGGALAAVVHEDTPVEEVRQHVLDHLRSRPVVSVLVVEDLHWADEATLDLLRFLARRLQGTRSLLVLTHRDDELGRDHPVRALLGDLSRDGRTVRVALQPLSVAGVVELASGRDVDALALHRLTGGNPFFVTEVLAAPDGTSTPATVRDAVLARVARLSPAAHDVLDLVAVARPPVPTPMVMGATGCDPRALDEAVEAGVLVAAAAGVAFRHDLARRVVDEAVPPGRRVAVHERALAWLERSGTADPADLAHHAEGTADAGATIRHARRAAEQARSLGAHRQAAAQYERALRWSGGLGVAARADLLEQHSLACYVADDADAAVASRAAAVALRRRLPDPVALGDGLRWLSRMSWVAGHNRDAEDAAEEALRILSGCGDSRFLALAHSNLAQLRMLARDTGGAVEHGDAAIALAERLDDPETIVHALNNVGTALCMAGSVDDGIPKLRRSLALARQHGLDDDAARAYCNLASGLGELKQYALAAPHLAAGIEFCADRQLDYFTHYLRAWQARIDLEQGRWTAAEHEATGVLELPHVAAVTRIVAATVLGVLSVRRSGADPAGHLDAAHELAAATGDLQRTWPVAAGRAELAWWRGDAGGVDDATRAVLTRAISVRHPWAVGELALWRCRAGLDDEVADGSADAHRLLAHGPALDAARAWHRLGAPYEEALALAGADDVDALGRAHQLARDLGAGPLGELVARRLRAAGGVAPRGPRASTRAHPAGLTPRQVEVLELVALGLSDAEIGARLFISPRTAGHHVSAILHKLGIRTRVEAAVAATRGESRVESVAAHQSVGGPGGPGGER